ncbi:MAG: RHS repeat-associated core domain-containing protein [Blastocatellia bacterium]
METYAQSGQTTTSSFTGMNQDTVSALYDFPAREYGIQGRWPSPDLAGIASAQIKDPQTWNRYAYVRNNPLKLTDSTGMMLDDCGDDDGCGDGGGGGGGGGGCADPSCRVPLNPFDF